MKIKIRHWKKGDGRAVASPAVTEIEFPAFEFIGPLERLAAAMERIADAMELLGRDEGGNDGDQG